MRARAIAASLGLLMSGAHGAGLDLSLSNDSAYIVFLTDSGSLGYGGADLGFGFFYNENDDYLGTANLMVVGVLNEQRNWQFGVGAKAYAGELDSGETVLSIAVGGQARYVFQSRTPVGLVIEGYIAPEITSFDDTKSVRELSARVEVEILPSTRGYVGYRFLETETKDAGDTKLDDNLNIGIRLQF